MYIIPRSKCATVLGDVDGRRLQTCGKRGYMGILSAQFCYELKTALKCSVFKNIYVFRKSMYAVGILQW